MSSRHGHDAIIRRDLIPPTPTLFYVPADFDTKEKALSGAKAAEKGLK